MKAKAYRSWRPSIIVKPTNESFQEVHAEMDETFQSDRKTRLGSFCLADTEGRELEHSWNDDNLHRFYV
jgi:hypothetical protein